MKQPETSIYKSYLKAIENAKTFIYIENQFFISPEESVIAISSALINRVAKAVMDKKEFKVIVLLPLHPEGEPTTDTSSQRIIAMSFFSFL